MTHDDKRARVDGYSPLTLAGFICEQRPVKACHLSQGLVDSNLEWKSTCGNATINHQHMAIIDFFVGRKSFGIRRASGLFTVILSTGFCNPRKCPSRAMGHSMFQNVASFIQAFDDMKEKRQ